tara:strand:+ start:1213 stop:3600 length:2388 start_codon:yes stop_codon:yes gene_type:complete
MSPTRRSMPTHYGAEMKRIIRNYEDHGMGILHGLQKDNIQNSWGARLTKKGQGFSVKIQLFEEEGFSAVTFTDAGTKGLTGTVYENFQDVKDSIDRGIEEERLANFETHKNIGLNRQGQNTGGFVGQGKLISNLNSKNYEVFYDSLRSDDEKYLINTRYFDPPNLDNDNMDIFLDNVIWDDSAKSKLQEISKGYLKPLETSGTRIIILNPSNELINYIKSGDLLSDIEDTWWEVLLKFSIDGIFVNYEGQEHKAQCPEFFEHAFDVDDDKVFITMRDVLQSGKIRKAVFGFADKKLPNRYNGLTIQRANMPINQAKELYGTLYSPQLPDSHKGKFFGIILLDSNLESAVRGLEHETHYSLDDRPRRGFQIYDAFKNAIMDFGINALKNKHGIGANRGDTNQRARTISRQTKDDVNALFRQNGITGGIPNTQRSNFIINVKDTNNIKDPNLMGDELSVQFEIKNRTYDDEISTVDIKVFDEQKRVVENLVIGEELEIGSRSKAVLEHCVIKLNNDKYESGVIYKIVCSAKIGDDTYKGDLKIYLNRLKEPNHKEFIVTPTVKSWPRSSNKRVDTGEKLKDISCRIASGILDPVEVFIDVQLYNKENNRTLNGKSFISEVFTLAPNGTKDISDIPDITLDDETTDGLGAGEIYCRFSLRAAENFQENKKGDQLASGQLLIYFNCDQPGSGIFEEVSCEQCEDNVQAKYIVNDETGGFICIINSNHKSYNIFYDQRDDTFFEVYQKDLVIRQGLNVCFHRNMINVFDVDTFEGLERDAQDEIINQKHGQLLNSLLRNE